MHMSASCCLSHRSSLWKKTGSRGLQRNRSAATSGDGPPDTGITKDLLVKQSMAMFAAGGVLGPFCDSFHSAGDVLHYTQPTIQALGPIPLETCWWVPVTACLLRGAKACICCIVVVLNHQPVQPTLVRFCADQLLLCLQVGAADVRGCRQVRRGAREVDLYEVPICPPHAHIHTQTLITRDPHTRLSAWTSLCSGLLLGVSYPVLDQLTDASDDGRGADELTPSWSKVLLLNMIWIGCFASKRTPSPNYIGSDHFAAH